MLNLSQNSDGPIGTEYALEDGSTRYGCACRVYLPTVGVVDEISANELWAAMFG